MDLKFCKTVSVLIRYFIHSSYQSYVVTSFITADIDEIVGVPTRERLDIEGGVSLITDELLALEQGNGDFVFLVRSA